MLASRNLIQCHHGLASQLHRYFHIHRVRLAALSQICFRPPVLSQLLRYQSFGLLLLSLLLRLATMMLFRHETHPLQQFFLQLLLAQMPPTTQRLGPSFQRMGKRQEKILR